MTLASWFICADEGSMIGSRYVPNFFSLSNFFSSLHSVDKKSGVSEKKEDREREREEEKGSK